MKVSLNWLKDYVHLKGSPEYISNLLTMAGLNVEKVHHVNDDVIFEIEITTNRPDWLSHIGVAREIHAVSSASFRLPPSAIKQNRNASKKIKVSIENNQLCPYYSATILEGIEWHNTPEFMKKRLQACGIRTINLIVDTTNYVLLEWGQPLHAFDLDSIYGEEIIARPAREGERINAIDGITYELRKNDVVIADQKGPVAIGGIMGGKETEVHEKTKNILLESAFFKPSSVRQTARRLVLGSESSYRFERRVDPEGVDKARERAVYLICKYAKPKQVSTVFRSGRAPVVTNKIRLSQSEIRRILGIGISNSQAKSFLKRLGLFVSIAKNSLITKTPSFRCDLTRPIDLIEEIARLYGYHKIPETLPELVPIDLKDNPVIKLEDRLRSLATSLGFNEIITFSIVDEAILKKLEFADQSVRLVNPQNKELCLMRPNLLSGLAQSIRRNIFNRQTDLWFFEIGNRYAKNDNNQLPNEERMLGLAVSSEGRLSWLEKKRAASFYDLKGVVLEILKRLNLNSIELKSSDHPLFESGEAMDVYIEGDNIGHFGTLSERVRKIYDVDKPVYYAELSIEKLAKHAQKSIKFNELPKFPSSPRDLTLIVPDDLKADAIINRIKEMAGDLAVKIEVFDYFKGGNISKGKKSLSFRIDYQAKDRTLQNEEVNKLHFSIIDSLNHLFGAELPKAKFTSATQ